MDVKVTLTCTLTDDMWGWSQLFENREFNEQEALELLAEDYSTLTDNGTIKMEVVSHTNRG
jgi:hypothetical protein